MTELAFDRSTGAIVIAGEVAGIQTNLTLDTGCPWELLVPYSQALEAGWIDGTEPQYDPRIVERRAVRVGREIDFTFKGNKLIFKEIVAWDLDNFRGGTNPILGLKFVSRFRTEFDFASSVVRLHKLASQPSFPSRNVAAVWLHPIRNDALLIRPGIDDLFGWFIWDTGAETSALFRPTIEKIKRSWAKKVKWSEPKEHTLTGLSRLCQDFVVPEVILSGFYPGSKTPAIKIENAPFSGIDFPEHQFGLEAACGLPLMGLINAHVFDCKRLLMDPDYSCLWTAR